MDSIARDDHVFVEIPHKEIKNSEETETMMEQKKSAKSKTAAPQTLCQSTIKKHKITHAIPLPNPAGILEKWAGADPTPLQGQQKETHCCQDGLGRRLAWSAGVLGTAA